MSTTASPGGLTPDEAKLLKKQLQAQAKEIVILKKHSSYWQRKICQEDEAGHYSISKMCQLLDIPRATYYLEINPVPTKRIQEQKLLDQRVSRIYQESNCIYVSGNIY